MASKKRLIDADARIEEIKKAHCTGCKSYGGVRCLVCWVDDAIGLIDDAPTVDAVEVVRCCECAYGANSISDPNAYVCNRKGIPCYKRLTPVAFGCICGKRREGE